MNTTKPPLSHRFGAFWGPAPSGWCCTYVSDGEGCDAKAVYSDGGDNGACEAHAVATGAVVNVEPEICSCDQAIALKAQLREAAANVGELLALIAGDLRDPFAWSKLDAARNWLKAYLAKGGV